jgi:hypothetical protein
MAEGIQIVPLNQSQLACLFRAHLPVAQPVHWLVNQLPELKNECVCQPPPSRLCLETKFIPSPIVPAPITPADLTIDSQGYMIPAKTRCLPPKNTQLQHQQQLQQQQQLPENNNITTQSPPKKGNNANNEIIKEVITNSAVKDGFRWRKYGQKPVKNSPFPRHYYKCTIEGCTAKKHVETFTDPSGQTKYKSIFIGEHMHDSPEFQRFFVNTQEELRQAVISAFSQTEGYTPPESTTGKRKRNTQPRRLEVECSDNINVMKDGYKWRKYGQKHVKGSTFPRAYYKCMPPGGSIKCSVKKMVERTDQDTTLNIYEGCHTHPPPPENLGSSNFRR